MRFSVIVVSLNPGEKLNKTLESIFRQTCGDYEIVLKDGGSRDGSVERWRTAGTSGEETSAAGSASVGTASDATAPEERVRFFDEPDRSIYEAMNQAVSHAKGDFLIFMNCGDTFADERVLEKTADAIERSIGGRESAEGGALPLVLYGSTLGEKNGVKIAAPSRITGFTCYRNIPCHQSCFYSAGLCRRKPYDPSYKIRADYDHFLWCFYEAGAEMVCLDFVVAAYEGGGYSESRENRSRNRREHREITEKYMSRGELLHYRAVMLLTMAPLRSFMAENRALSGVYHRLKEKIYKGKH